MGGGGQMQLITAPTPDSAVGTRPDPVLFSLAWLGVGLLRWAGCFVALLVAPRGRKGRWACWRFHSEVFEGCGEEGPVTPHWPQCLHPSLGTTLSEKQPSPSGPLQPADKAGVQGPGTTCLFGDTSHPASLRTQKGCFPSPGAGDK